MLVANEAKVHPGLYLNLRTELIPFLNTTNKVNKLSKPTMNNI